MRKITILAVVVAALAIPATASATWTDNHVAINQNQAIQFTGQFKLASNVGSIECQVVLDGQLLSGQTTGLVQQFDVDAEEPKQEEKITKKCALGGGLVGVGCKGVINYVVTGEPWTFHAVSTQTIAITTNTLEFLLEGGAFCPDAVDLTPGTIHIQTTTQNTWSAGQFSGQLQSMVGVQNTGNATITGSLGITPGGRFGVI